MQRETTFRLPSVGRILIEFLDGRDDPGRDSFSSAHASTPNVDAHRRAHAFFSLYPHYLLPEQRSQREIAFLERVRSIVPSIAEHATSCLICLARSCGVLHTPFVLREQQRELEERTNVGIALGKLPREEACALVGELVRLGLPERDGEFLLGGMEARGPIIVRSFERI